MFKDKTPPRHNREERRAHPHPFDLAKKQIAHILDEQRIECCLFAMSQGDLQTDAIVGNNLEMLGMLGTLFARLQQRTSDMGMDELGRSVLHWHQMLKGYLAVSNKRALAVYIELKKTLDTFPQEIKEQAAQLGIITPVEAVDFDPESILKEREGNNDSRGNVSPT